MSIEELEALYTQQTGRAVVDDYDSAKDFEEWCQSAGCDHYARWQAENFGPVQPAKPGLIAKFLRWWRITL